MKSQVITLLVFFLISSQAASSTFRNGEKICPIDGTKFKTRMAASGTQFGKRLDLKPTGAIAAPWPLAVCPSDKFVFYKAKYSAEEIKSLKKLINSNEYKKLSQNNSSYYLLAKIYEHQKRKSIDIAFSYLKASWQVDPSSTKYKLYSSSALKYFNQVIKNNKKTDTQWQTAQLVAGALERRLGLFEKANKRFANLKQHKDIYSGYVKSIINLQLELIEKKDNKPRNLPKAKAKK